MFSDPNGYADLPSAQMLIGGTLSASGSCYLYYSRAANLLYLMNDAASAWTGPVSPGGAGTVENSRCRVDAAASSVSGAGNNLTVNVRLSFKSTFAGSKKLYMFTQDNGGLTTGWQQKGSWTP
jgi:hypothetical protein